jgi:hypothetical protein
MKKKMMTAFAPAERSDARKIDAEYRAVSAHVFGDPYLRMIVDSVLEIVLILDGNRQIVFSNDTLHRLLGIEDGKSIRGLRPGEMLGCRNAASCAGGCGTSEFCRKCGAVKAILSALGGTSDVQECSVSREGNRDSLDLMVSTSPMDIDGERYTLFAALDISDKKRRSALERIFFHDVMNTVGIISNLSEILERGGVPKSPSKITDTISEKIHLAVQRLIDEIGQQQQLSRAESDELEVKIVGIDLKDFVNELAEIYRHHTVARGKSIAVSPDVIDIAFYSDPALLRRIVGNMVKNALEASEEGETVTIGCGFDGNEVELWVHNDGVMPEDVQLQIFKRSFTTKGNGRGLGTYSMKLLGETYLGGTVSFESAPEKGTTFFMRCRPVSPAEKPAPDVSEQESDLLSVRT